MLELELIKDKTWIPASLVDIIFDESKDIGKAFTQEPNRENQALQLANTIGILVSQYFLPRYHTDANNIEITNQIIELFDYVFSEFEYEQAYRIYQRINSLLETNLGYDYMYSKRNTQNQRTYTDLIYTLLIDQKIENRTKYGLWGELDKLFDREIRNAIKNNFLSTNDFPNIHEFKDFEQKLYITEEVVKYCLTGKLMGYNFAGIDLLNHIDFLFSPQLLREKERPFVEIQYVYDKVSFQVEEVKKIKNELHKRILNQIGQGRMEDEVFIHEIDPRQIIHSGADLMYKLLGSGTDYRVITEFNPDYFVSKSQRKVLNHIQRFNPNFFEFNETLDGCQIYLYGGGALREESEYIVSAILSNVELLRKNENYQIEVISIDSSNSQLKLSSRHWANSIELRVNEELEKKGLASIEPNISLKQVKADFLEKDFINTLEKEIKNFNNPLCEKWVISATSTISNMKDNKDNENQQQQMIQSAYKIIKKGSGKGKLYLGSALKGDATDYKSGSMDSLIGNVFRLPCTNIPNLTWEPIYGGMNSGIAKYDRPDRHQFNFIASEPTGYTFIHTDGIKHKILIPKGSTFNVTFSQRFNNPNSPDQDSNYGDLNDILLVDQEKIQHHTKGLYLHEESKRWRREDQNFAISRADVSYWSFTYFLNKLRRNLQRNTLRNT